MGDILGALRNVFGQPSQAPLAATDDADFANYAAPSPVSIVSTPTASISATNSAESAGAASSSWFAPSAYQPRPYTAWYRVWERVTIADFYSELFILPFIIIIVVVHFWGTSKNKRKASGWIRAHAPLLEQEYACVGFDTKRRSTGLDAGDMGTGVNDPIDLFKEKAANEFVTYATGRQNVAFLDIKLLLAKRYNPMGRAGELTIGFFVESMAAPKERMEATAYVFDGREHDLIIQSSNGSFEKETFKSSYDGFVFAIVHKESMKSLRESRYDLSLTTTKDSAKLPPWATVMSESAEVSDALLTTELVKAVEQTGELLEALIITDMPLDQPKKLNDVQPRKRLTLLVNLPSSNSSSAYQATLPIFRLFLRLPDILAAAPRYRPEALRRVKATREDEIKKIKKNEEDERADDRRTKFEKQKKEERERMLKNMSAEQQRKFREKETATELRRGQKKKSVKA
ncbi:MAG: hypothetical protein M1828_000325 [Chrysothrix sp. TS-e1954]|nr:MAG: hypothetical protein M1828_000325 [Chrysothrix sp. TS-e1954]